jgi:uncharacterized protein (TIGR03067 family)
MKKVFAFGLTFSLAIMGALATSPAVAQDKKAEEKKEQEIDVMELMQEGQQCIESQDYEGAAKAFQKVVDAEKDNSQGWLMLGYALHSGGKMDEAIVAHKKAAAFDDVKSTALYNLGCAYSLKNELDLSIKYLHDAISENFTDLSYFNDDADLVNVRKDKRFEMVMARAKNRGKDPGFANDKLLGEWKIISGKKAGEDVGEERLATVPKFEKDKVTIPSPTESFVMSYKLNTRKYPVEIDLKIEAGPAPEGTALGIMQIKDDELTFCYDPTGAKRPEKFESTSDNGFYMFVMKKVKADDAGGKEEPAKDKAASGKN